MKTISFTMAIGISIAYCGLASAASVQFVGANPIASPTYSTEFSSTAEMGPATQSFDGFIFSQIMGDPDNDIWGTYDPGNGDGKGWYPNGGDFGYTQISLANGSNFGAVSLFVGSGFVGLAGSYLQYQLLDDGNTVLSGSLLGQNMMYQWMSISGGGFDTIRLSDCSGCDANTAIGDGHYNALALDKVLVGTVPLPGAAPLLLSGLGALGFASRRRKANAEAV